MLRLTSMTATKASLRADPTACANSGEKNGLDRFGSLACMRRHTEISVCESSPSLTTEILKNASDRAYWMCSGSNKFSVCTIFNNYEILGHHVRSNGE